MAAVKLSWCFACDHGDYSGWAQTDVFVSFFATNMLRTDNRNVAGDDLYRIQWFSFSLSPAADIAKFSAPEAERVIRNQ